MSALSQWDDYGEPEDFDYSLGEEFLLEHAEEIREAVGLLQRAKAITDALVERATRDGLEQHECYTLVEDASTEAGDTIDSLLPYCGKTPKKPAKELAAT